MARPMPEVLPVTSAVRPERKVSVMRGTAWCGAPSVADPAPGAVRTKVRCRPRAALLGCGMASIEAESPAGAWLSGRTIACGLRAAHCVALRGLSRPARSGPPRSRRCSTTRTAASIAHDDDLLTAGLGLDGLRAMAPPAFADPETSARPSSCAVARSGATGAASPISRRAAVTASSTAASPRCRDASSRRTPRCPARAAASRAGCRCRMRSTPPSAAWW